MLGCCLGLFRRCYDLPEEVLVEIFSWLPTDSLIRFKCVSKSWYALISFLIKNPEFVSKHLRNIDNKISSSTCLVFCCAGYGQRRHPELKFLRRNMFQSLTIFHDDDNERDFGNYVPQHFDLPLLPARDQHASNVVGIHCDGIICQADYHGNVILCNPAIKEWRTLPKPRLDDGCLATKGVGFGYDPRANDYKVVRFGCERIPRVGQVDYSKTKAEVYSMGTDSWREIGIHLKFDRFLVRAQKFFSRGVFYWSMWAPTYMVISFHMSDELFHSMTLPNDLVVTQGEQIIPTVTVWNESVALFLYHAKIGVAKSFEVWVMDDYYVGIKGTCSWIRKLVVGPLVDIATPLAFLKNDEFLMEATDGSLILYDLRRQVLRKRIQAVSRLRCWDFSYVKSLVSVQGGSQSR
ncbi:F-box domain containing protein [Trema orientale]|uniref:F-box domain containing protein n=1 Tax=Trema orientale TaxID=63057 RepID=A0A2P5B818_TREOI|nr:F-box domain containing protein [Trema orientale]